MSDSNPHPQQHSQPVAASSDDRTLAMLAHGSSLVAMIISATWLSFVGPLVIWMFFKDRSDFVRQASAKSFNFNIGMTVLSILGWIMVFTVLLLPIGLVCIAVSVVMQIVCHIIGVLRASNGRQYDYPMRLRILAE